MIRLNALLFALAWAVAPALAQDSPEAARGYLNAFACEVLPQPVRVHVEVMDNSDQNLRLRDQLAQRLQQNGAEISDAATLVLSLEVAVARQATRHKPGDMIDVRVGQDEPEIGQEGFARLHMNVWSSRRDSLLTGRRSTVEEEGFDLLRLRASLNSRSDGHCLWQGELVHNLDGDDPYLSAAKLIPVLADSIGQAANRKPVPLD